MKDQTVSREGYLREEWRLFHLRDTAGQERDFHFHDFDKLVILLSGHVEYTVESATYALQPWDVLLVKHHTIHRARIDRNEPYERVILYLNDGYHDRLLSGDERLTAFDMVDRRGRYLLTPDEEERATLADCLRALEAAVEDEDFGVGMLRNACLIRLMVVVERLARRRETAPAPESTNRDARIARALDYINENLNRDISVEEIAEAAWLSKYYFMRLFKAQTGESVYAYLRRKRLMNAARLIREGTGVAQAAAESGFGDYSTFYRAFRETFGISPGELR